MDDQPLKQRILKKLRDTSPVRVIVSSFFVIILIGTVLLCLPISSRDRMSTGVIESLFTATSTTCVTGLALSDTWTKWSIFGQVVILLLIQLGGLGLVTFTTGFTLLIRRKLGLKVMQIAQEHTSGSAIEISKIIRTIIFWTLSCELVGCILFMIRFVPQYGLYGVWVSIFTSVSAYCNAGFDILGFTNPGVSLSNYSADALVLITSSLLIALGGIGFLVVSDIHSYIIKKIKNKRSHPHLNIHSNIVISTTIVLLLLGTILFFIFEYNNTLNGMSLFSKINVSFFQSSSARTAGFFAVPIGQESDSTKFITILLMFIGASPASTGGGIKTTTFIVLIATVKSILKGDPDTTVFNHKINKNTVYKALTIVFLGVMLVCIVTLIIDKLEASKNITVLDILFESVSAFATVGLTTGITPLLSDASKLILIFSMFVGRVGAISLVLALTSRHFNKSDRILPEGRVVVG